MLKVKFQKRLKHLESKRFYNSIFDLQSFLSLPSYSKLNPTTLKDFLIISPEIVISFTAILVFLLDLFINDKKILVPVSISGLVISFILTLGLWNGWLIESPGIYAFFSSIKLDEFSLFFKVLIILSHYLSKFLKKKRFKELKMI